ncbi:polysaccharide deacetylase family protein [Bacillus niameyensis]|uniref:polysaccharide deacetylase family protein n=1 Tax=Bacillus niameyensis TaxID=1522308 RepID=UPI000780ED8E|nr:polysaccharide deacetylase family protein [Bacillus niameyensis]
MKTSNKFYYFSIISIFTITLSLVIGLFSPSQVKSHLKQMKDDAFQGAQPIIPTLEVKHAFSTSKLNQSIHYQQEIIREKAEHGQAIKELQQKNKVIYLTFDDGPSAYSEQMLDILNKYDAKATFFMIGPNIQSYPAVVKRMADEGFGIGMHSMTHDAHQVYSSATSPLDEMLEESHIIQGITGIEPLLIRLPYGSVPYLTVDMRYYLNENNFKIWDWNIDSEDWKLMDQRYVTKVIQDIKSLEQSGEAPIVLLHDKQHTVQHLSKLLQYLKKEGYQMKVLTEELVPYTFQCEGRCYSINE